MKEQLVSTDTALLARRKGFDWICDHWVYLDTNCQAMTYNSKTCCSVPTQSVLQKWLREVHNIHITVDTVFTETEIEGYDCYVYTSWKDKIEYQLGLLQSTNQPVYFQTYEEALESVLQKGLHQIVL